MENTLPKVDIGKAGERLQALEAKKTELADAVNRLSGITCTGLDDKEGRANIKRARLDLRNMQIPIEKEGKEIRDVLNAASKFVLEKEREICAIAQPLIDQYKKRESELENEEAEMAAQKQREFQRKVDDRIAAMRRYGREVDSLTIGNVPEDVFQAELETAQKSWEEEQEKIAAQKRAEEEERERLRKQAEEQEAERARLAAEREAIERQKAEIEAKEREQKAADTARREAEEKAEREKAEAAERAEREKREAVERAQREAREEAEKAEAERLAQIRADEEAKAEALRQAALAPDKEKLQRLADAFEQVQVPELKDESAKIIAAEVNVLVGKLTKYIRTKSQSL